MYTLKFLFYASIYVKLVFISLFIILTIMFAMGMSKIKKLMAIKSYIKNFEDQFWSGIDLTQFYTANHENNLNSPLGMIFKAVWEEWTASEQLKSQANSKADIKERMLNVAHRQKVIIMQTCENYMDALATFIHTAPFLGLLGTTLGLIDVFYNLDVENGLIDEVLKNNTILSSSSLVICGDCVEKYNEKFEALKIAQKLNFYPTTEDLIDCYLHLKNTKDYMYNAYTLDALYARPSQAERVSNNG